MYPTGDQRRTLRLWFDAARWCCNEAVARLRRTGEPANWKAIKTEIIHAVPERLRAAPYEVKSISVRDDCRAVSEVRRRNRRLAKRNKYRAASRMRVRIGNLTDELHHQAARWLVDNFDVILLPTFETSDMARRGARKLRSKSVRSLLTYDHYRFQKFLTWKAWQVGKELVLVNEAYTSKTCSWSGEIIPNLGGRRAVAGSDGVRVDRDINGARGIFLRTLGDTPALRQAAQEYIGNCAVSVS